MKPEKVLVLILAIIIITISATVIVKIESQKVKSWSMPYNFSVESRGLVGISVDTTLPVRFGSTGPGSTLMRYIDVGNNQDFPVKVNIKGSGTSSDWVSFKDPGVLDPHTQTRVGVYIKIPDTAPQGEYKGMLTITILKS